MSKLNKDGTPRKKPVRGSITRKKTGKKDKKTITVTKKKGAPRKINIGNQLQRKEFAHYYLIYKDKRRAAKLAGYTDNTCQCANTLISHKEVRKEIQKLMNARAKRLSITADNILQDIRDEVEKCKVENDHAGVFKGSELLGKHLKLFEETKVIKHTGDPDNPIISKWEIEVTHVNKLVEEKPKEVKGKVLSIVKDDAEASNS